MVCDCADVNHDHADALLTEVYARLGKETEEFMVRTITPGNSTTEVIRSLWWDLRVSIDRIACDQWFGISARRWRDGDTDEEVFIQCDRLEHGLAAPWKRFADIHGLSPLDAEGKGE